MKPVLLVIDMQEKYYEMPRAKESLERAAQWINAAIALFREKGLPVIVIEHMEKEEGFVPGSPGYATHKDIALLDGDARIHKAYGNAFNKTQLLDTLKGMEADTLIITGFCAEFCVLSTYRGAQDQDLKPVLMKNALASYKPERIPVIEEISDTVTLGALQALLG
jgi:nicotinamidase-related amidase